MNHKVLTTIKTVGMLRPGDTVVAGVSGGADSVALLHILSQMAGEWDLTLRAAHLNHCLRGAESERDEAFVRALCRRLGLDCAVRRVEIGALAAQQKLGVEECARRERYRFFHSEAAGRGIIATGHTLSDSLETVLFNLARGTALRGMCGIPPMRQNIIRPLIACTREEVEEYCAAQGLKYITDSSNLTDDYSRNRIRHQVLPTLRGIHPGMEHQVAHTLQALRADEEYLSAQAARALEELRREGRLDRRGFMELPLAVSNRVLVQLLEREGILCSRQRLEQLQQAVREGRGGIQLSPRHTFFCTHEHFFLAPPPKERPFFSRELPRTELLRGVDIRPFSGKRVSFCVKGGEKNKYSINSAPNLLKNALDYDKIGEIVVIRQRQPGDRLLRPGRSGTKTLKKLFNELHLPPENRSSLLVVDDGEGPVWVEGVGPARRVQVDETTQRTLYIEVMEDEYAQ